MHRFCGPWILTTCLQPTVATPGDRDFAPCCAQVATHDFAKKGRIFRFMLSEGGGEKLVRGCEEASGWSRVGCIFRLLLSEEVVRSWWVGAVPWRVHARRWVKEAC